MMEPREPISHVLAVDGTWQRLEQKHPTNIGRLVSRLEQGEKQAVVYAPGPGTDYRRLTGGLLGWGIRDELKELIAYLAENYRAGDRIYLLGFSRGAIVIRYLMGYINAVGLPRPNDPKHFKTLFKCYTDGIALYHDPIEIEFCGLFDCVGSHWPGFKDLEISPHVKKVLHLVSIDEQRRNFKPVLIQPDIRIRQEGLQGWHTDVGGGGHKPGGLEDYALSVMHGALEEAGCKMTCHAFDGIKPDWGGNMHPPAKAWKVLGMKPREFTRGWVKF